MVNDLPPKKVVLVIEDDPFLARLYRALLEMEGFAVLESPDGDDALKAIKEKDPPDLVILDLMLPRVSGFDVLEAIRSDERWGEVPVFVLTTLGQEKDIRRAMDLGATDYLVKADIKISDAIRKVKKYLAPNN